MMEEELKHENNGECQKCEAIFNKYPSFHPLLKEWFKELQKENIDAHISCAGRGKKEQEEAKANGVSRAHYGESSHNFNMAIDLFQLLDDEAFFDKSWYEEIIPPRLNSHFLWYGDEGSYREYPHVELRNWKLFTKLYPLVEP